MAIKEKVTENYAIYEGDCIEKLPEFPNNSIHLSIYSPPFASLYTYSSSDHDLGNCKNYDEFLEHYEFVVKEIERVTMPGRMTCVHCMDIPLNSERGLIDFPGDIIRIHQNNGFYFWDRHNVWKEPLRVAIRSRARALMHQQLCRDSSKCRGALADYVLVFKKRGENEIPIQHPVGLTRYAGDIELMNQEDKQQYLFLVNKYKDYTDDQTNRLSQFIWRRYASSSWEDVRANRMMEYKPAKDQEDDRHVCPLHLDVIERAVVLWSNPGEKVLTPFMGVGSEVYGAVICGRKGIGIELKDSYFRQAVRNLQGANEFSECDDGQCSIFDVIEDEVTDDMPASL